MQCIQRAPRPSAQAVRPGAGAVRGSVPRPNLHCGRSLTHRPLLGVGAAPFYAPAHRGSVACAAEGGDSQEEEEDNGFISRLLKPLSDFGFGRKSIWEGGVGAFVISGVGLAVAMVGWVKGVYFKTGRGYECIIEFPSACGITVGTPVRIRGVQIGSVLNVNPHLDRVDVLCEIDSDHTVIPRNSLVQANQSGLIAEPLVDVTPGLPIPEYGPGPLDEGCSEENFIVCDKERIGGERGVSMDDLVYICTKLANQVDTDGVATLLETAAQADKMMKQSEPLIDKAAALMDEINPLLHDLQSGNLVANIESLTDTAAAAAADIQKLQTAVLDDANTSALRDSVVTLTRTLEHIENITGNVGTMTADGKMRNNLRSLIESLSRLVDD